jgi:hypothetical protein
MIDADELINAIGDDGLKQVVASVVGDAGVEITSDMLTTLVEAVKQGIRDACDEVSRENAVQKMIQRETRNFFRRIGARPNGRQFL